MSDYETCALVVATARRVFDHFARGDRTRAWDAVSENGFPLILVPEDAGGLGLDALTAREVIALAAVLDVDLPLADTLAANLLLTRAGREPVTDVAVIADSQCARVPFAPDAAFILAEPASEPGAMALLSQDRIQICHEGHNLAGSRRCRLEIGPAVETVELPGGSGALERCGAAIRIMQMVGAARATLELTVGYAQAREQFGRPLAGFQVIQQDLARMAEQVAALEGASGLAAEFLESSLELSIGLAAARVRANEAAGTVAALAHQIHGAIGFAAEYELGKLTKRLWSWRAEYGGAVQWQDFLADRVFEREADELWPMIVAA